jgi:hypothetical protein
VARELIAPVHAEDVVGWLRICLPPGAVARDSVVAEAADPVLLDHLVVPAVQAHPVRHLGLVVLGSWSFRAVELGQPELRLHVAETSVPRHISGPARALHDPLAGWSLDARGGHDARGCRGNDGSGDAGGSQDAGEGEEGRPEEHGVITFPVRMDGRSGSPGKGIYVRTCTGVT